MTAKLEDAGEQFAQGTYQSISKAFYDLGDFVMIIPQTIQTCPEVAQDAKTWSILGATFKDFGTFCSTVGSNFWNNYGEYTADF